LATPPQSHKNAPKSYDFGAFSFFSSHFAPKTGIFGAFGLTTKELPA
jgi:hypothetical protein